MAMGKVRAILRRAHGRAFALAPWCLLVFTLVVLHAALMTREHHAATAGAHEPGFATVLPAPAAPVAMPTPEHGDHDTPRDTLDGCPVGQAILPLILLLFGILGPFFTRPRLSETGATAARCALPPLPPPLPATQRRTVLQVFII
ncbi:MAG TPA: hypothetical protein VIL85_25895 [Thermomicrobiales bacterium]|jgi:hypothetical protein